MAMQTTPPLQSYCCNTLSTATWSPSRDLQWLFPSNNRLCFQTTQIHPQKLLLHKKGLLIQKYTRSQLSDVRVSQTGINISWIPNGLSVRQLAFACARPWPCRR